MAQIIILERVVDIVLFGNSIAESASIGDLVGLLSVSNPNGSYTFTITTDTDNKFALDSTDNTRLELAGILDFETASSHEVTISADNGIDDTLTKTFSINVINVPASILLSNDSISEGAVVGSLIGTLSIFEPNGSYTFSITSDADSKFILDATDNTRLELNDTLDYETNQTHRVTIQADNGVDTPHFTGIFN